MSTVTPAFPRQMALLARRLRRGLPGVPALLSMAPADRGYVPIEAARANGCREAAVLALLYPLDGTAHVVLTLRQADLTEHAAQVSFPGGRCAAAEAPVACALREAHEELAIPTERVEVLGPLTPVYIAPSAHCVQAFLATMTERPAFRAATAEVAQVIEVPLVQLLDHEHRGHTQRRVGDQLREVPHFLFQDRPVWGATAMMLAELGALWADVLRAEASDAPA